MDWVEAGLTNSCCFRTSSTICTGSERLLEFAPDYLHLIGRRNPQPGLAAPGLQDGNHNVVLGNKDFFAIFSAQYQHVRSPSAPFGSTLLANHPRPVWPGRTSTSLRTFSTPRTPTVVLVAICVSQ